MQLQYPQSQSMNKIRTHYRALDDGHTYIYEKGYKEMHFLRRPILEIDNKKLQNIYSPQEDYTPKFETKSEIRRSNLSRMNQELEQRTNLYAHLGKYESKWTPKSSNYLASTDHNSEDLFTRSQRSSSYYKTCPFEYRREQYYRPLSPLYNHKNQYHTSYQMLYPPAPAFNTQAGDNNQEGHYTNEPPKQPNEKKYKARFDSTYDAANAVHQQAHQAKQALKQQAHEAKEQVKDNAKQTTRAVVGEQNFQLMRAIKHAAAQIKDNMMESIKVIKDAVVHEVKQTANVVADQAIDAKDAVKDQVQDAADVVKDQARNVKHVAEDATDAMIFHPNDAYAIRQQREALRANEDVRKDNYKNQQRAQRQIDKNQQRNERDYRNDIKYQQYADEYHPPSQRVSQIYYQNSPEKYGSHQFETSTTPFYNNNSQLQQTTLNSSFQQDRYPGVNTQFSSYQTPSQRYELETERFPNKSSGEFSHYVPRKAQMAYTSIPYKSLSANPVQGSPITYTKKTFSIPPSVPLSYCWVFTLLAIGFFLVIFQLLK